MRIVFVHGWGMHRSIFDGVIAELGAAACAPDVPGYGGTDFCEGGCAALATGLSRQFDGPLIVCGWSLGAQIALRWALAEPQRVTRLILVGGNPRFVASDDWPCGVAAQLFTQFAAELALDYAKTITRFVTLQADAGDRATLRELRAVLTHLQPTPRALRQGLDILLHEDLRSELGSLRTPTLVVHGDRDMLVPRCAADYLAEHIPHAELACIADAGHAPFLSHRAEFVARVREFAHG